MISSLLAFNFADVVFGMGLSEACEVVGTERRVVV